ncbi:MAG: rhomboid family intramembrane serine protease, partial [Schleiferiaceae bacterium]|nr:rhomboid family intramembrane serine protease [Schleiferiaceae bacterium]
LSLKIKHLLPTFLLVVFGSTLFGMVMTYFLRVQFDVIRHEWIQFWVTVILPWVPISIWLRPKLRILRYKDLDRGSNIRQMLAWGMILGIMINMNQWTVLEFGKNVEIESIEQLDESNVKFFSINELRIDLQHYGVVSNFKVTGKNNRDFTMEIFFVRPIPSHPENHKFWIGKRYSETIPNRSSDEKKDRAYRAFVDESYQKFEEYDFANHDYFEVLGGGDHREFFIKATKNAFDPDHEKPTIVVPHDGSLAAQRFTKLKWAAIFFGCGSVFFFLLFAFMKVSKKEVNRIERGGKPKEDDLIEIFQYLIPKKDHFITSIIIDINLIVYILMLIVGVPVIGANAYDLMEWGANRRAETLGGEWWRLLTSMFVHGNIMHILMNLFAIGLISSELESAIGRIKYTTIYLASGIISSLASLYWHEHTASVGASGAIFGIYGAQLALGFIKKRSDVLSKGTIVLSSIILGVSLLIGFFVKGVDNAAHIGGLISGAIIALALDSESNSRRLRD